jgi:hypothetical protein
MARHFDRQGKPPYAYHAVRMYPLVFHSVLAIHILMLTIHKFVFYQKEMAEFICLVGYILAARYKKV